MAFNIHISGPKVIMHNKTLAEMFVDQLNNNEGLFGVSYMIFYDAYGSHLQFFTYIYNIIYTYYVF
jgi:hypothetical protein